MNLLMKKYVILLLILLLTLSLSSCKSDDSYELFNGNVVSLREITSETKVDEILCLAKNNNNIILIGKANINTVYIYIFDENGKVQNESYFEHTSYLVNAADVDIDGNIWVFFDKNIVSSYNTKGDLLSTIELDTAEIGITALPACNRLIVDDNGFCFTSTYHTESDDNPLFLFDYNGNMTDKIELFNNNIIKDIYRTSDYQIVIKTYSPLTSSYLFELFNNTNNNKSSWELTIYNAIYGINDTLFNTGFNDYKLLRYTDSGIFGYNIETGENTLLIDWNFYDVNAPIMGYAVAFEDFIFTLMRNPENKKTIDLVKLAITDMDSSASVNNAKKTLVAAGFFVFDPNIRNQIQNFNTTSSEYRIELFDYFETAGSFETALQQFNMDIIAGNIPDIILFNDLYTLNRDNYANKGLFVDLYTLMENDPDINKDDYLPNVLNNLEINNNLFFGATSFYIKTLIGKTSDVGSNVGWSWDDFIALMDEQPSGIVPFAGLDAPLSKTTMLRSLLNTRINDYIDTKAGTCDFINTDFIKLLEFSKSIDNMSMSFDPSDFSTGNPLLLQADMFDFYNLKVWENIFEEEVTFIGYPTSDGKTTGSYATFYNTFAISAQSEYLDGAWEFAKYLLVDCQEKSGLEIKLPDGSYDVGFGGFPIKISELYRLAEDSRYLVEERTNLSGDEPILIIEQLPFNTDTEINKILDLVLSINDFSKSEGYAFDIIFEEIDWFFEGQKTAEEVAAVIQDKINIYLGELK